jgi:hypothetical protein
MALYRCYLMDVNDHVLVSPEIIDMADDRSAVELAKTLWGQHPRCFNIEVWLGDKLVERIQPRTAA